MSLLQWCDTIIFGSSLLSLPPQGDLRYLSGFSYMEQDPLWCLPRLQPCPEHCWPLCLLFHHGVFILFIALWVATGPDAASSVALINDLVAFFFATNLRFLLISLFLQTLKLEGCNACIEVPYVLPQSYFMFRRKWNCQQSPSSDFQTLNTPAIWKRDARHLCLRTQTRYGNMLQPQVAHSCWSIFLMQFFITIWAWVQVSSMA